MEFSRSTRLPQVASPLFALVSALAISCGDSPSRPIERRLDVEGTFNFREAGGYDVVGGGSVATGLLFRSDSLEKLQEAGAARIEAEGIRLIVDLRASAEASEAPDVAVAGATRVALPVAANAFDGTKIREAVISGDLSAYDAEGMKQGYRDLITQHGAEFVAIFERLADPAQLPMDIHCTQGKDRTGVTIALVLLALGVPEATVLDDYLLTNEFTVERNAQIIAQVAPLGITEAQMMPLLTADPAYLMAALDELENGWGSVEAYLTAHGLGADTLAQVRANLVISSRAP